MFYEREVQISDKKELGEIEQLLQELDLKLPKNIDYTVGVYYHNKLVGTGSLVGNILQGIGVSSEFKEQGLAAKIVSSLMKKALENGHETLYIYTKPREAQNFLGLGFRIVSIAEPYAALLEWGAGGIEEYKKELSRYAVGKPEKAGCIVVNCNPFTLGHRYLIETAVKESPWVYVLVVEEDKSLFPFRLRFELIREGTKDLINVTVIPGGKYIISSLTFPAYFTREEELPLAQTALDLKIFSSHIAPALKISRRYVGEEPYCPTTAFYNESMSRILPKNGIELVVIKRLEKFEKAISASRVRELIREDRLEEVKNLVPEHVYLYLTSPAAQKIIEHIKKSVSRH